ncbi:MULTISPECIES: D-alanyl-lipoteichoic acid biosynthesis protein DltD [Streptococcus]|uniref:Protein DltD n=2 Tax=Streptococcus TaxID=1301 RepID=A0A7X1RKB4_STRMT|nr:MULTISPECIES: D-alanyl-lipoteichoic acid biosynthesis protein DltD [Streptococcus]MDI1474191.1 D-alanyl-lipoteichoic acid biosynthesis protein DltD [Streptococcus sp. ST22-14]MQQ51399.1 D-alanyl-lipoteichoic acid biosynthesis protein DltD [Streptococcus mitis]
MLKRLWLIFGPVFVAGLLVCLLICFYPSSPSHNLMEEKYSAASISAESFKERSQKVRALTDPNIRFIPFLGSSEWIRFDSMHPGVLAEKYNRSYRPYFMGQAGAASLSQYFGLQQITSELENKQAVFVISPQWFTKEEHDAPTFQSFFNNDQLTAFLENQSGDLAAQYAATRLLKKNPRVPMKGIVEKLAKNEQLSDFDQTMVNLSAEFNERQAALFGQFSIHGRLKYKDHIEKYLSSLPEQFSYEELENIARKDAEENTTNNDLGMDNHFYTTQLKKDLKNLEGYQKNYNFLQSTEYNDLQLVLDQFAKSKVNVLFVFQPVNQKWMNYTGLSEEMYQHSIEKIRYQLESQGFTNIADFSKNGGDPYFVKDTIHIGWLGWLAFDKVVNPFLSNPTTAPSYQMNDRFFSQDWANYDGNIKDFQ